MTTVWITKYALSTGIFKVEANTHKDNMVTWKSGGFMQFAHGQDFHLTAAGALDRAEEMRIKKLQSLDKQAKKIAAMKFTAE